MIAPVLSWSRNFSSSASGAVSPGGRRDQCQDRRGNRAAGRGAQDDHSVDGKTATGRTTVTFKRINKDYVLSLKEDRGRNLVLVSADQLRGNLSRPT